MKNQIYFGVAILALAFTFSSCEKTEEDENGPIVLINTDIDVNTTWTSDKVYVVENWISVDANLTIEPGTVIKFKTGAGIGFGSSNNTTVIANGTQDKRIVFTSYSATPSPGAWQGINFYSNTLQNSSITFCDFDYAGVDNDGAVGVYCKLTFNNNRVRYAKSVGIWVEYTGSFVSMNGNVIEGCGTHPISIYPYAVHTLGTSNQITGSPGYGIFVFGGDVLASHATSATWRKQTVPYIIDNYVGVATNFTIEPGTILAFNAYGLISFGVESTVTINAIGTSTEPIIFTSSNATPSAGAWNGIEVYGNTNSNSKFEYCHFNYAGKGSNYWSSGLYVDDVNGLTVKNCTFNSSAGWGIYLDDATLSAQSSGNNFVSCAFGSIGTN